MAAARRWTHVIRFILKEDGRIHLGQIDSKKSLDIRLAFLEGKEVEANCISRSVFDGVVTDRKLHVADVSLVPLEMAIIKRTISRLTTIQSPASFTVINRSDTANSIKLQGPRQ